MNETLTLKKGEFLLREGDPSTEMYLLTSGHLSILKGIGEEEREIGKIHPNQLVGELSFLDRGPRSASVLADTDCTLVIIKRAKFDELLNSQQEWFKKITLTLVERLRKANERIKI